MSMGYTQFRLALRAEERTMSFLERKDFCEAAGRISYEQSFSRNAEIRSRLPQWEASRQLCSLIQPRLVPTKLSDAMDYNLFDLFCSLLCFSEASLGSVKGQNKLGYLVPLFHLDSYFVKEP